MPECLDNMPWRSLKGLGDMAPDFLRLGDFKNVRLKDDTLVQFRIIGSNTMLQKWSYPPTDLGDG